MKAEVCDSSGKGADWARGDVAVGFVVDAYALPPVFLVVQF